MKESTLEKLITPSIGWGMLGGFLVGSLLTVALFVGGVTLASDSNIAGPVLIVLAIGLAVTCFTSAFGFIAIQPNEARVLLLFGNYIGTVKESGFYWVNPFYSKKKVSLRIRNFETGSTTLGEKKNEAGAIIQAKTRTSGRPSKVNDRDGNPIDITAVVV
ncbi:MAG: SPFH domain-containing protein, partial [Pirellula sp.]